MATFQTYCQCYNDEEAKDDSNKLHEAMDGCGTNEEAIIEVLVNHNNAQRQQLRDAYATAYGKRLDDDLVSELGGDLENTVVGLLLPPRQYDAKMLHDAMSGIGTVESTLVGVLCTRTNEEINQIVEAYKEMYDADLQEELNSDVGGYFGRMLYSLAQGARQEGCDDEDLAREEAQKLVDAGVGQLGTDECDFNSVLCLSSYDQLRRVFEIYKELREGTDIEEDIDSEMSSDLKDGYLAIVKVAKDKSGYFAERLNAAMRGLGTDDDELIRLIISRSEDDLEWVKEKYEQKYETPLYDDVASECSGHYKRALLSVIQGKYVGPDA